MWVDDESKYQPIECTIEMRFMVDIVPCCVFSLPIGIDDIYKPENEPWEA